MRAPSTSNAAGRAQRLGERSRPQVLEDHERDRRTGAQPFADVFDVVEPDQAAYFSVDLAEREKFFEVVVLESGDVAVRGLR